MKIRSESPILSLLPLHQAANPVSTITISSRCLSCHISIALTSSLIIQNAPAPVESFFDTLNQQQSFDRCRFLFWAVICCPYACSPMPAERFFIKQARRETGGPVCSIQKPVHPAGGQSRPPLRITEALKFRRRGRRLCRPEKCNEFAENSRKNGASQAASFTPVGRLRFYTRSLPLPPA